jgi:hypothetical protein
MMHWISFKTIYEARRCHSYFSFNMSSERRFIVFNKLIINKFVVTVL